MVALHKRLVTITEITTVSADLNKCIYKGLELELCFLFDQLRKVKDYNIHINNNLIFITGVYNLQGFNIVAVECDNY